MEEKRLDFMAFHGLKEFKELFIGASVHDPVGAEPVHRGGRACIRMPYMPIASPYKVKPHLKGPLERRFLWHMAYERPIYAAPGIYEGLLRPYRIKASPFWA